MGASSVVALGQIQPEMRFLMTPPNQDVPQRTKICNQGHVYAIGRGCLICAKERHPYKEYYWRNPEKMRERGRKWGIENREYQAQRMRKWRSENVEHVEKYRKEWEEKNYDKRRKAFRNWYMSNRVYNLWRGMVRRCTNDKCVAYRNYGSRGIKVCDRWMGPDGYKNFESDMGPCPSENHSIERKDVNGDYCPSNCKWATTFEQTGNRRNSVLVEYQGKTYCIARLAREVGMSPQTLMTRIKIYGWTVERAVTEKKGLSRNVLS